MLILPLTWVGATGWLPCWGAQCTTYLQLEGIASRDMGGNHTVGLLPRRSCS